MRRSGVVAGFTATQHRGGAAAAAWGGSRNGVAQPGGDAGNPERLARDLLADGEAVLTKPASGEELESERLKAKFGVALIERDLLHKKLPAGGQPPFGPRETRTMSEALSPVSGRRYGLATVCRVWRVARSGVYRHLKPSAAPPRRPGPAPASRFFP